MFKKQIGEQSMKTHLVGYAVIECAMLAICLAASPAGAGTYSSITTNMGDYVILDQTDTWTGCKMIVTNSLSLESNAVVRFFSSTNECYLPVSASYRQTNYVGRYGPSSLWFSNSTYGVTFRYYIGVGNSSSMHLTDSTFRVERDPTLGTFYMYIGSGAGSHTGELELVRSRMLYNNVNFGGSLWLGNSCFGRLTLHNSTLGTDVYHFENLSSYGGTATSTVDQAVGWFNASTVMVSRCAVGGDPEYGPANGTFTFTNGSLLRLSRKPSWQNYPGLYIGYTGGKQYTSTVTVAGSRVENTFNTVVGYDNDRGKGRLTFSENAVGVLSSNVTLGVKNLSCGYLNVLSGSQVFVTNGLASLTVGQLGYGLLTVDGGTCRVNRLYLTNGVNSVLAFNSGTLSVKTGLISNNTPVVIGTGTGAATLDQWGGGTTTVHSAMSFPDGSRWRIDADATTGMVLDVHGTLTFGSDVALTPVTTNAYAALNGRSLAVADAIASLPHVQADGKLTARIEDAGGGRKALVLHFIRPGTIVAIQ